MSSSALDVVSTTTGIRRRAGSDLISLRASRSSGSSSAIRRWTGWPCLSMIFSSLRLPQGQGDDEGATLTGRTPGGDGAAVAFDDLAADGQADAGALVFPVAVQTLKRREDS